jgi:hypothetical protein
MPSRVSFDLRGRWRFWDEDNAVSPSEEHLIQKRAGWPRKTRLTSGCSGGVPKLPWCVCREAVLRLQLQRGAGSEVRGEEGVGRAGEAAPTDLGASEVKRALREPFQDAHVHVAGFEICISSRCE